MILPASVKNLGGGQFLWGAHHPHCDRHHNHLLWIHGHPFCLGCTCMYTGIIIGIPLAFMIDWANVSLLQWAIFIWITLAPTLIQIKAQYKIFKIVSRTLLGISISLYWISGLFFISPPFSEWLFRALVLGIFVLAYHTVKRLRYRYTKSPCEDCPLGYYPTCEWNLPRLLAENADTELLEALSSDNLRNLVLK